MISKWIDPKLKFFQNSIHSDWHSSHFVESEQNHI